MDHDGSLRVLSLDNGVISRSRFEEDRRTFTGAAYDGSWRLVGESVRPANTTNPDDWRPVDPLHLVGRSGAWAFGTDLNGGVLQADCFADQLIDGGHLFGPWGHFLIESLSTAWSADLIPSEAALVLRPWGALHGNSVQRRLQVLRAAGWGDRTIIVTDASWSCRKLYVPERATRYGNVNGVFLPEFRVVVDNLRRVIPACLGPRRRVLLVAASQPMASSPLTRSVIDRFVDWGFEVLDHEDSSDPISGYSALASAEAVASFSGSHLHNALVAPPGTKIIELSDSDGAFRGAAVQASLAELLGHDLHRVSLTDAPAMAELDAALAAIS